MPIGGSDGIGWDEGSPPTTENAGLGAQRIQSLKTSLRQALDSEHNFPSTGGDDVGYHRYGSARPYYGPQSTVSSSGSDGRLMLTSDSSRLFGVGSVSTSLLGGPTVLLAGSFPGSLPQRSYWAVEFGQSAAVHVSGDHFSDTVTFPNSGFSGAPYVLLTPLGSGSTAATLLIASVNKTTLVVHSHKTVTDFDVTYNWVSIGTRTL